MKDLYEQCLEIATKAHEGQFRKFGDHVPYITHPVEVARTLEGDAKCVAVLHDVIEDTAITADDLLLEGIPERIVRVVLILTRRKEESYYDYLQRVMTNATAMQVKLKDLEHNLKTIPEGSLKDKYLLARQLVKMKISIDYITEPSNVFPSVLS